MGTAGVPTIIDGDGHVIEFDDEIIPYLTDKYPEDGLRNYYLFPTLDGWRRGMSDRPLGYDAKGWGTFLERANIDATVLYPTIALAFAFAKDPVWAADLAHAYNRWVSDRFLTQDSRLKAVAVLPVQDPQAAAQELRYAVKELGMVGGLLPTPGLRVPYGHESFDLLYREAESLGVMVAVHGASRRDGVGIGLDYIQGGGQTEGFVLSHLFGQMSQFTNMILSRVWERFPNLKVVFLEAGCGWVPYLMERIDRRTKGLASAQVRNSPIYFHAELEEEYVLPPALNFVGDDRFIYASDYPHETHEAAIEALDGFLAREDITVASKNKLLCDNIKTLYGF